MTETNPDLVTTGDAVLFVDENGRWQPALVTHAHAAPDYPCPTINLVTLEDDPKRDDGYGRQIKRPTSVPHISKTTAKGFFWCMPDEARTLNVRQPRPLIVAGSEFESARA